MFSAYIYSAIFQSLLNVNGSAMLIDSMIGASDRAT